MENSKLVRLVSSLKATEFDLLGDYLKSPFLNRHASLISLYEYLKLHYPKLEHSGISKEAAQRFVFKEVGTDNRLRQLFHKMCKAIEDFFVQLELRKKEEAYDRILIQELGRRQLYKPFKKAILGKIASMQLSKTVSLDYHQDLGHYIGLLLSHPDTRKFRGGGAEVKFLIENQLRSRELNHLRYQVELINRQNTLGKGDNEVKLIPIELQHQEKSKYIYSLYESVRDLLESGEDLVKYAQVKQQYDELQDILSWKDKKDLYHYLQNYLIQIFNKGDEKALAKVFELVKFGYEKALILDNGRVTDATFTNVVATAVANKDFDWALGFMTTHKEFLEPRIKDQAVELAKTYYHYHRGEFKEALHLTGTKILRYLPSYGFRIKSLTVRSAFQLCMQDKRYASVLKNEVQAFEKYLRRKKLINHSRRKAYLNFISLVKKILLLPYVGKQLEERVGILLQLVKDTPELVYRKLLEEKIEQILKGQV